MSKQNTTVRSSRVESLRRKEEEQLKKTLQKSQQEYDEREEKDACKCKDDIIKKLVIGKAWNVIENSDELVICSLSEAKDQLGPQVKCAVVVNNELLLNVYLNSVRLPNINGMTLPLKIDKISTINDICHSVDALIFEDADNKTVSELDDLCMIYIKVVLSLLLQFKSGKCSFHHVVAFVYEQLELLTMKKKNYSYEFLIFSSIFYNVSPHAYRFLRNSGNCILPCYSTIRKLTLANAMNPFHEQSENTFLYYIKQKFNALSSSDSTVSLMVDEIHLKPFYDYKGGTIAGVAFDSFEAANSAFVFMISSLFSAYKDVVHVLPSRKMSAETLYDFICKTVKGLETLGFRVISVITDNNSINRKAMSYFASPPQRSIVYPHPSDNSRPLFFILDSVHILKCIRNNWLNQKTENRCINFPSFQYDNINSTNTSDLAFASFDSLKQLHHMEAQNTLKFSYKLSVKALHPSNLERQNVKLVLQLFSDYVSQSLLLLGNKFNILHYHDTGVFVKVITTWWEIVNVKTPRKGRRLNNKYQQPLVSEDTDPKLFLKYFSDWLSRWESIKSIKSSHGKLTSETFYALQHTTNALLEVTEYCLSELGAQYVLLGKFQTDCLEARFGQYRQLAEGEV